ncbi:MAG TPA: phosphatase PAP2 family protein [Steroidobacteraceae bacterium]|nr:phosphatase PAP2 family protein [Steroidobacteraceae bacterium]
MLLIGLCGAVALSPATALAQSVAQGDAPDDTRSGTQIGTQGSMPSDDCQQPSALPGCPTALSRSLRAIEAYITAPTRWDRTDWMYFGGTLAAIGVAYHFDGTVRTHFAGGAQSAAGAGSPDTLQDALPAAALFVGTWGYANLIDDDDGRHEAHSMLEATALSLGTAYALSYIVRRQGPDQSTSPGRFGAGGTSFPSEHTTAAFAIGTVLAESGNGHYRWVRRVLGYGVAGFTAYERLDHNAHWLSDTVAGAALGAASARFAMDRRRDQQQRAEVSLSPIYRGVMLTYTVRVR